MPSDEIDEDLVERVVDWIGDNSNKLDVVEDVVEYEENNTCESCVFDDGEEHGDVCWIPGKDVSMPPYYMGALKTAPFIGVPNDTNNNTNLSLKDLASTREALRQVKGRPEEHTDEWAEKQVQRISQPISDILDDVEVSKSDKKQIMSILEDTEALEYWHEFVAYDVKYRDTAKKAITIMLASPDDAHGNKGRINIKIYGPPGTGKSALKSWLRDNFGAETIDGPRVSKADLTYNKSSDEIGKLPQAHNGILVVEEADEMDEEALGSTLTSLGEEGMVEIRDMQIPAATRGVMLSNFESEREIMKDWSPESLNRFDFVIGFELLDDDQKSETLDYHYEYFRKPKPGEDDNIFKKYIKFVRSFEPELDEIDKIKEFKDNNIDKVQNIREGISLMNVAWTIARLNLEDLKLRHYKKAFELVTSSEKTLKEKYSGR